MFKTMLVVMMILRCASLATAQSDDHKKVEVFGGYSYHAIDNDLDDDDVIPDPEYFRGFNTSITGNIRRYFGLKFDFPDTSKAGLFRLVHSLTASTSIRAAIPIWEVFRSKTTLRTQHLSRSSTPSSVPRTFAIA